LSPNEEPQERTAREQADNANPPSLAAAQVLEGFAGDHSFPLHIETTDRHGVVGEMREHGRVQRAREAQQVAQQGP
jgi:hypothetical protein